MPARKPGNASNIGPGSSTVKGIRHNRYRPLCATGAAFTNPQSVCKRPFDEVAGCQSSGMDPSAGQGVHEACLWRLVRVALQAPLPSLQGPGLSRSKARIRAKHGQKRGFLEIIGTPERSAPLML
jgi:hypothetical protein